MGLLISVGLCRAERYCKVVGRWSEGFPVLRGLEVETPKASSYKREDKPCRGDKEKERSGNSPAREIRHR